MFGTEEVLYAYNMYIIVVMTAKLSTQLKGTRELMLSCALRAEPIGGARTSFIFLAACMKRCGSLAGF